MMEIVEKKISDLVEKRIETFNKNSVSQFRYVDISSIDNIKKEIVDSREILSNEAPSRAKYVLKENDVIVSNVRPNLNAVAVVNQFHNESIGSSGFTVLRALEGVESDYLFLNLISPKFLNYVESLVQGAMYPAISDADVKRFKIKYPKNKSDQKRIASELKSKLKSIEQMRQAALQQKEAADVLQTALLRELFNSEKAKSWEPFTLGDFFRLSSGDFLSAENVSKEGFIPVYGGNGILGYTSQNNFSEKQIVIGRVGALCGNVHETPDKSWITDNALYIKKFLRKINKDFLVEIMKGLNLNQYANKSGQPFISGGIIYHLEFKVPKSEIEQRQVAEMLKEKISHFTFLKQQTENQLEAIEAMPAAILREVFDFNTNKN